ncbi:hypothetical protein B0H14DRAFT_3528850 [Mycena olivaceomarginata]|nr:hypothetical protein B0H14DRAFT_3528850 [Mycena olivaceomarginata]
MVSTRIIAYLHLNGDDDKTDDIHSLAPEFSTPIRPSRPVPRPFLARVPPLCPRPRSDGTASAFPFDVHARTAAHPSRSRLHPTQRPPSHASRRVPNPLSRPRDAFRKYHDCTPLPVPLLSAAVLPPPLFPMPLRA